MVRVEVPQRRGQRLGGQEHRPGGLEPVVRPEGGDGRSELLEHHLLPRVELEDRLQVEVVPVGEARTVPVEADPLHLHQLARQARLHGGVHDVARGHEVLAGVVGVGVGEVVHVGAHAVAAAQVVVDAPPLGDELLVQPVPLVEVRQPRLEVDVLVPVPLDEGGLEQAGGGVGVVLQHPRRAAVIAGVDEVEARVEGGIVALQRGLGVLDRLARDAQVEGRTGLEGLLGEESGRVPRHEVEVLAGHLQGVHLAHGELVAGVLVPVTGGDARDGIGGVGEDEALERDGLPPALARRHRDALHRQDPDPCPEPEPKPPRLVPEPRE